MIEGTEEIKIPYMAAIDIIEYFSKLPQTDDPLANACKDHAYYMVLRRLERETWKSFMNATGEKRNDLQKKYMEVHIEKLSLQKALYGASTT